MKTHDYRSVLLEAASSVLEEAAFAPVMMSQPPNGAVRPCIVASVSFQGEVSGRLDVTVPRSLARQIASNMMGCRETDVTDAQVRDAVGEIGNMMCGSFVRRLGYTAREEHMSSPVVVDGSARVQGAATPPGQGTEPPAEDRRLGREPGLREESEPPCSAGAIVSTESVSLAASPERVVVTLHVEERTAIGG